jgi:hypothetical protein
LAEAGAGIIAVANSKAAAIPKARFLNIVVLLRTIDTCDWTFTEMKRPVREIV